MGKKLPSEKEFQLMTLVIRERSGREVAKLYRESVGKPISYGTLYTTFSRLRDETGWVRYRDKQSGDGRVRLIELTGTGAKALNRARRHYSELAGFGLADDQVHG